MLIIAVICYMIAQDLYRHARPFAPGTSPTHLFSSRAWKYSQNATRYWPSACSLFVIELSNWPCLCTLFHHMSLTFSSSPCLTLQMLHPEKVVNIHQNLSNEFNQKDLDEVRALSSWGQPMGWACRRTEKAGERRRGKLMRQSKVINRMWKVFHVLQCHLLLRFDCEQGLNSINECSDLFMSM